MPARTSEHSAWAGAATHVVSNTLLNSGSRVLLTQTAGLPLSRMVSLGAGQFRVDFATAAVGGEAFYYETDRKRSPRSKRGRGHLVPIILTALDPP